MPSKTVLISILGHQRVVLPLQLVHQLAARHFGQTGVVFRFVSVAFGLE